MNLYCYFKSFNNERQTCWFPRW